MSARTRGVVACVLLLVLAGCSSDPPEIDAPDLSAADAAACRDLVDALPDTLAGQDRVDVTGETSYGAAWGDPAIVLTCGVDEPEAFTDSSTCVQMDTTGWFVPDDVLLSDDDSLDVTTTEMNYRPRVELFVPGDYRPEGFTNSIGAIGPLVQQHLKRVGRCH
ncbi:MAG: DUF3515 domain-containing protein [Nocardioides sp.]|nr:DUF3515 domain-containing protein [Nocardioidaceae bacterium]MCB8958098.1 DUF3515 domain-containing protein [Nocardioides sp.]